ncbi:Voltage-gated hydrogen channel 1 [Mizuhopecten yessoensis]|uniref:Voltage-gated hydrogen channel 1 n=2 Tax=Mizuhopecten yessoensis TaxID=6573 RepID=A0A210QWJ3_MIZYE|nr:Voltage-gated hydrogen channel 1 [Mizuhopecten yessoensis]
MSDTQHENDIMQEKAVEQFKLLCPALDHHSDTDHTLHLDEIIEMLETNKTVCSGTAHVGTPHAHSSLSRALTVDNDVLLSFDSLSNGYAEQKTADRLLQRQKRSDENQHHRSKRAAGGADDHDHGHSVTHEVTHYFHIGSMAILSILLFEAFLKVIGMGSHFLKHRLEVFDAFVVTVSWCLDVAFWEGIWAHPGTEAATILIIILPWRIIRIVNSFVLVIKEKDMVELKVVKQQYRSAIKVARALKRKRDMYRVEARQLQGLCRKHTVDEAEIIACAPLVKQRRRSSSLFPVLSSFASLAMIGAVGTSVPDLHEASSEEEEEDKQIGRTNSIAQLLRSISSESELSGPVTFSLSPDPMDSPNSGTRVFTFDGTSNSSKPPRYDQMNTTDLAEGLHTRL